ncbi:MAG: AmmeMemoRadiSam system protein A [Candidatus Gastranaerophilales bacterium]|nr:AmmeMemoRadiSam system protein A [Candidatus Gastranaerophilales bacterium]
MKPVEFAKLTVEKYIKENKKPSLPLSLVGIEVEKAGSFVSIKTKNGDLRGCIGTIFPTKNTIIEEIVHNAISASTQDPRFEPIKRYELNDLVYSVDVLHPPEDVASLDELDPNIYGIIVLAQSGRQALLLPDLEGVDTVEDQIAICMRKAGIPSHEAISIKRFKVDRYKE